MEHAAKVNMHQLWTVTSPPVSCLYIITPSTQTAPRVVIQSVTHNTRCFVVKLVHFIIILISMFLTSTFNFQFSTFNFQIVNSCSSFI